VNIASFRLEVDSAQSSVEAGVNRTRVLVREAESATVVDVLSLFRFTPEDVDSGELPVDSGQWKMDLFDTAILKEFGIRAGSNAARGGAIGAGIDVITGGLSLGLATALGATAGLLWSTARRYGSDLAAALKGHRHLCVTEGTLKVLWMRQAGLLNALLGRGHASRGRIQLGGDSELPKQWAAWLVQLRNRNEWAALGMGEATRDEDRDKIVRTIAERLISN
jgi:hypothetical protein